ncbi:hypothetical protein F4553_006228 [Allocatelliglobosispora scoriae]|uniref:DUF2786 domain-containing protein n=1 Tax=Allocatelliglobosispora scoriae TaxID=643052 RepID=A0A841BXB0_9ACTN|nr:DUF2786 domain-containing protein [Allocatelliglobosispora scoriae]MBB5872794.1 hypothetical protein [Allocatelliglobosispora scoriae]
MGEHEMTFERLQQQLSRAWDRGWMPADLIRFTGRQCDGHAVSMLVDVLAAEIRRYPAATVEERWERQLSEAEATVWWRSDETWLDEWSDREGISVPTALGVATELNSVLLQLPKLPRLCALPGAARRGSLGDDRLERRAVDQRKLDKLRALLAKAESTSFPDEAEAYTAKAQELMARYSIDYAWLSVESGSREIPSGRRVGIDNPYEGAKALLLNQVAGANRCTAVWSRELGFVTVLGFAPDLDAVELLYTSLRVQATTAMMRAGFRKEARSKSFRRAFLTAYAGRIGQRLADAADAASRAAAAQSSADLLPVLAARGDEVREATAEMFPQLVTREVKITNRAGWASGVAAADLASLGVRQPVAADPRSW